MKKTTIIVTLGLLLVMGTVFTFAVDTPNLHKGNGLMMQNKFNSPEEALNFKLEKIDLFASEGKITPEQATEFKKAVTERINNCDGTKNRDSKERLGIGFGRHANKGQIQRNMNR